MQYDPDYSFISYSINLKAGDIYVLVSSISGYNLFSQTQLIYDPTWAMKSTCNMYYGDQVNNRLGITGSFFALDFTFHSGETLWAAQLGMNSGSLYAIKLSIKHP